MLSFWQERYLFKKINCTRSGTWPLSFKRDLATNSKISFKINSPKLRTTTTISITHMIKHVVHSYFWIVLFHFPSFNINIVAAEQCLTFTSLNDFGGSVLHDGQDATCFTFPRFKGVTPLLEIELTSDCRDRVENNQVCFIWKLPSVEILGFLDKPVNNVAMSLIKMTFEWTISDWATDCVK